MKAVNENWSSYPRRYIYSIVADENLGFGAFFMEGYGNAIGQSVIIKDSFELLATDIKKEGKESFIITSCTTRGSTYCVVMTKMAKHCTINRQVFSENPSGRMHFRRLPSNTNMAWSYLTFATITV